MAFTHESTVTKLGVSMYYVKSLPQPTLPLAGMKKPPPDFPGRSRKMDESTVTKLGVSTGPVKSLPQADPS